MNMCGLKDVITIKCLYDVYKVMGYGIGVVKLVVYGSCSSKRRDLEQGWKYQFWRIYR